MKHVAGYGTALADVRVGIHPTVPTCAPIADAGI